jgi:hypothetical protein
MAAGASGAVSKPISAVRSVMPDQCKAGERVLYACVFPRGVASLCANGERIHYRFGPRGRPQIDLASRPDWSNVRWGEVRGQGNGHQRHVRISQGGYHYVIYEAVNGDLSDSPGYRYSGINVLKGERQVATLSCPSRAVVALGDPLLEQRAVAEDAGGPFDMWF